MTESTVHSTGDDRPVPAGVVPGGAAGAAVAVPTTRTVEGILELALDLCVGVGAFAVSSTGAVQVVVSGAMPPEDAERRLEALARSCVSHPAADGHDLFWNAEVSTEAESADASLACAVLPLWSDGAHVGLMGVADVWLPEPDDEQRAGLAVLGARLAALLAAPGQGAAAPGDGDRGAGVEPERRPEVASVPPTEPGTPGPGTAAPGTPWPEGAAPGAPGPATPWPEGAATEASAPPPRAAQPSDTMLSSAVRYLPEAVLVVGPGSQVLLANRALAALAGAAAEDLAGRSVATVLSADPERERPAAITSLVDSGAQSQRLFLLRPWVDPLPVDVRAAAVGGPGGEDGAVLVVTPARSSGPSVAGVAVEDLVENLDDGVMCLDQEGSVVLANRAANELHGLPAFRTLAGSPLPMVSALRTEDGQILAYDNHPGLRALRDGSPVVSHLTVATGGDDRDGLRHVAVTARRFRVAGGDGALVVLRDTTAEWMEQQRLAHYALHDPLTGLANRYLLIEELRRMLQGLGRRGGSVALVFLDLDNFKRINDHFGHDVGDEVLIAVARRLKGAVRSDDVVARLGGDEFVIAHPSRETLVDGDMVVSRARKVLSAPFRLRGEAFDVGASIGWVSTETDDVGPDALLAKADRAMYRQKRDRALLRQGGD